MGKDDSDGFNFVPFRTRIKDGWVQIPKDVMFNLGLEDNSKVCLLVVLGDSDAKSYDEIGEWTESPEGGL